MPGSLGGRLGGGGGLRGARRRGGQEAGGSEGRAAARATSRCKCASRARLRDLERESLRVDAEEDREHGEEEEDDEVDEVPVVLEELDGLVGGGGGGVERSPLRSTRRRVRRISTTNILHPRSEMISIISALGRAPLMDGAALGDRDRRPGRALRERGPGSPAPAPRFPACVQRGR